MELNNVIENLKASVKSKQEELEFYTNKVKQLEVEIYKLLGSLELADYLNSQNTPDPEKKDEVSTEVTTESKE